MENQGMSDPSGPYQVTSSVPYLEEGEELTCRAENAVGGAERTYPPQEQSGGHTGGVWPGLGAAGLCRGGHRLPQIQR